MDCGIKRTLFLMFFLGFLGFALPAQTAASPGKDTVGGNPANGAQAPNGGKSTAVVNNPNTLPRSRSPNARVTVTPGPQGLPIVDSSASAWPLGPGLKKDLEFWLNGSPQAVEGGGEGRPSPQAVQDSRPRTSGQSTPSFEPPPTSGLPSFGAPRSGRRPSSASMGPDLASPDPRTQREPQISPSPEEIPAGEGAGGQNGVAPQANGEAPVPPAPRPQNNRPGAPVSQTPRQGGPAPQARSTQPAPSAARSTAPAKKIVEVPSPVHYDRAGRRVIDPSWQETMYRMIRAEKEAVSPAETPDQAGADESEGTQQAGAEPEQNNTQNGETAGSVPAARETVIVVPGPALWRIRGTLTAAKGMLALEDDDGVLWYLPGLDRYIGFIDGLDAGGEAALEGYAPPGGSSQERYFQPVSLIIDEMAYDLSMPPYGIAAQPYMANPGGQTTIIREIERPAGGGDNPGRRENRPRGESRPGDPGESGQADRNGGPGSRGGLAREGRPRRDRYDDAWDDPDDWDDDPAARDSDGDRREKPPNRPASEAQPGWQHRRKSPWAPPAGILEFEMDYDSFWQRDEAKERQRERDSREIWY